MRRGATILAFGGLFGLTAVALAIVVDVLLRFFFRAPITGLWDIAGLLAAISVAAFFPLSLISKNHISIKAFGSLIGKRGEGVLDLFAALVCLVFFSLMTWQFYRHAAQLFASGESTPIIHAKTAGYWAVVAGLLAMSVAAQAFVVVRILTTKSDK